MTTYNHAMSVSFAVKDSKHEDPYSAIIHEKEKVISALLERVAMLLMDNNEYVEALEAFDTYEEEHNLPLPSCPTIRIPLPRL